ncbi:MAG: hypothetical protein HYV40_04845 [Candidatus Levybacteria bacterium]|nr:hypothetical protein [Candidatus Levybacteria bacterium]
MDISVNLARVSDWITKENGKRISRIDQFLEEIQEYLGTMEERDFSTRFRPTLKRFKQEFLLLLKDREQRDKDEWAERALTWANILQHRATLLR